MANKYENTMFYKLCCKDIDITEIYVGHTVNFMDRRKRHKCCCTNMNSDRYNMFVYQYIRENGGWENWSMILIESRSCSGTIEAEKVEREFIESLHAMLKQHIPSRTKKAYREANRDIINKKKKNYYEENKEELQKNTFYHEINKDRIKEIKKIYNEDHRNEIREKKLYNEAHKHEVNERRSQICTCLCGGQYSLRHRARHMESLKHLQAIF